MRRGTRPLPVRALALDYDGTLASDGTVAAATLESLRRLRDAGHRLILVTGRERLSLAGVFPHKTLFDRIVAENGALLYQPSEPTQKLLASPPPRQFIYELLRRDVRPLSIGTVMLSTLRDQEAKVREIVRESGLHLTLSYNRESLMILPAGVDKGTGLAAALDQLGISFPEVVAVGDAENDLPFLSRCGHSVAVANALPMVKEVADFVTAQPEGAGVSELAAQILTHRVSPADMSREAAAE